MIQTSIEIKPSSTFNSLRASYYSILHFNLLCKESSEKPTDFFPPIFSRHSKTQLWLSNVVSSCSIL